MLGFFPWILSFLLLLTATATITAAAAVQVDGSESLLRSSSRVIRTVVEQRDSGSTLPRAKAHIEIKGHSDSLLSSDALLSSSISAPNTYS